MRKQNTDHIEHLRREVFVIVVDKRKYCDVILAQHVQRRPTKLIRSISLRVELTHHHGRATGMLPQEMMRRGGPELDGPGF
jgi:hypothetical protein